MFDFKRFARRTVLAGLVLSPLALSPGAAAVAGPVIAPHRAVYGLSLAKSATGGSVAQAHGRLEFEWGDACTAWTLSQRTRVKLVAAEGQVIDFGWSLSALEAKDGSSYRFFIRRLGGDQPPEDVRGEARLRGPGAGGVATYSEPERREVDLPKGTMFPSVHSLLLLEAAERGEYPLGRVLFDGSGDEGIFFVNAAMSEALPADAKLPIDSPLLRGQKSWRLSLAYFGMDETVAEPEHEQALRLYANGIVDELILDYGDFALRASLERLEELPGAGC